MANLVLDVTVNGAKQAKNDVYKIGKAGEDVEKVFKRLGTTSFLKGLPVTIKALNKSFVQTQTKAKELLKTLDGYGGSGFKEMLKDEKAVLGLTKRIGDELEKQAKLQIKLARQGKGTPQQNALAKQLSTLRKQTEEMRKQTGVINKNAAATKKMGVSLGSIAKIFAGGLGFLGILSIISSIKNAISNLVRSLIRLGETAARSFFNVNVEMEQLRILMDTAAGSVRAGAKDFDAILKFATQAPFSVESLAASFVKLKTAGIDPLNDGTLQVLTDSVAAFGGSSEQLRLVTIAIQQMVGKGVISMEELRRQFGEQVPTAMRAMAKGLGMSILDMFDLIGKGGLEASKGIEAMLGVLKEWHGGAAKKRMDSMQGAVALLKTEWTKLMIVISKSNNIWKKMVVWVKDVAEVIREFSRSEFGKRAIDDLTASMDRLLKLMKPEYVALFLEKFMDGFRLVIDLAKTLFKVIFEGLKSLARVIDNMNGLRNSAAKTSQVSATIGTPPRAAVSSEYAQNIQAKVEVIVDKGSLEKSIDDVKSAYDKLIERLTGSVKKMDIFDLRDASLKGIKSLTDAMDPLIASAEKFQDMIKASLKNTEAMLDSAVTQAEEFSNIFSSAMEGVKDSEYALKLKEPGADTNKIKLQEANEILKLAELINKEQIGGTERYIKELERARDIVMSMDTETKKTSVSSRMVAEAWKKFNNLYANQSGEKGVFGETKKAYEYAKKLETAYKSGAKVATGGYSEIKAKVEEINRNISTAAADKKKELEDEIKRLEEIFELRNKQISAVQNYLNETVPKIQKAYADEAVALEKLLELRIKLNQEAARQASSSNTSSSSSVYQDESGVWQNRYSGGPVTSDKPYIVGEKGPELFIPSKNGNIVPNNELSASDTTEITLNFNGNKVGPMFSSKQIAREVLREFQVMQGALS